MDVSTIVSNNPQTTDYSPAVEIPESHIVSRGELNYVFFIF